MEMQHEPGCDICEESERPTTRCQICWRKVCDFHRHRGHLLCTTCADMRGAGPVFMEGVIAQGSPDEPPSKCQRCDFTKWPEDFTGICHDCNRWICNGCALLERPPRCVVCPARQRVIVTDLREPNARHPIVSHEAVRAAVNNADWSTQAAGVGRTTAGFTWTSREGARGQVHRTGERVRQQQDSEHAEAATASGLADSQAAE